MDFASKSHEKYPNELTVACFPNEPCPILTNESNISFSDLKSRFHCRANIRNNCSPRHVKSPRSFNHQTTHTLSHEGEIKPNRSRLETTPSSTPSIQMRSLYTRSRLVRLKRDKAAKPRGPRTIENTGLDSKTRERERERKSWELALTRFKSRREEKEK